MLDDQRQFGRKERVQIAGFGPVSQTVQTARKKIIARESVFMPMKARHEQGRPSCPPNQTD